MALRKGGTTVAAVQYQQARTFARTTPQQQQAQAIGRRAPRPLTRTQSINSGSTIQDQRHEAATSVTNPATQERLAESLVGSNVHGTYNAQRERTTWLRKPLFARPGDSGFSSGAEAAEKLEAEALRRDPYQVDFLESLRELTKGIAPLIEKSPKFAWVVKQLMEPERFLTFRISWKDDENNWRMNRGYSIHYSSALGPYKGPLIFDHRLTHGSMRMIAFEQVLKHALIKDEGWGGATAGADLDTSNKSREELRRFTQAFCKALGESIGGKKDTYFPAIDVDANTGRFVAHVADELANSVFGESKLKGKSCILSGVSQKSLSLAKQITNLGGIVVSFSDATGFLYDKGGFDLDDIESLEKLLSKFGHLADFRHVSNTCAFHALEQGTSLWEVAKGDIAFPAVAHSEISSDDAAALAENGTKLVVEVSDRACSENAIRVFMDRNLTFAPSKMALAAPLDHIDGDHAAIASQLVKDVRDAAEEAGFDKSDLQTGACIAAFKRLSGTEMFKV